MANGTGHMIAGGVTGAVLLVHERRKENKQIELGELGVAILIGILFGLLADVLEPASSPNHRAFFHSFIFLGLIAWQLYSLWHDESVSPEKQLWLGVVLAAYGSHLLLDAGTPKSLPLF